MMDYKSLMGYGKKKVVKEQLKPKKKSVLDGIKKELNEWTFTPPTEKRWSGASDKGLTEYEKRKEEQINEGPAYEYRKVYKDIEKQEKLLARSVDKLADLLDKKGLKNQSMMLKGNYIQDVQDFVYKWLKQFMRGIQ